MSVKGIMVNISEDLYYRFKAALLKRREKIVDFIKREIEKYVEEVESET